MIPEKNSLMLTVVWKSKEQGNKRLKKGGSRIYVTLPWMGILVYLRNAT
jgi:hypothetical protein